MTERQTIRCPCCNRTIDVFIENGEVVDSQKSHFSFTLNTGDAP